MNQQETEYEFFRQTVYSISSSLDLRKAMESTYIFLEHHFPIVGLSLHVFVRQRRAMHLLFLITKTNFHMVDKYVDLPQEAIDTLVEQESKSKTVIIPHTFQSPGARRTGKALNSYLPDKDRARLIALLSSEGKIFGHFSLMGREPECFTPEHERKLLTVRPALSLFMMNLLQYREIENLKNQLAAENRQLSDQVRSMRTSTIIGHTGGLKQVVNMIHQIRDQDIPVLITGETGTGKEVIADAIQSGSSRYRLPYIKVNCGAIPDTLIDSELFGHEKGAFTGAIKTKTGRFEEADGGTLFLDEIGDMPLDAQVRLLRVLQTGLIQRVGGTKNIFVDVRIIAATHQDLKKRIRDGKFREDLYYRLNVFPIQVPPLRNRKVDLVPLIHHFIQRKTKEMGLRHTIKIDRVSLRQLQEYPWPGNVRELENLVERAMVIDASSPIRLHHYLPEISTEAENLDDRSADRQSGPEYSTPYAKDYGENRNDTPLPEFLRTTRLSFPTLDDAMAEHIRLALELCNGKIYGANGAADLLHINPNTLRKRMDKLGIPYGRNRS